MVTKGDLGRRGWPEESAVETAPFPFDEKTGELGSKVVDNVARKFRRRLTFHAKTTHFSKNPLVSLFRFTDFFSQLDLFVNKNGNRKR